MRIKKHENGNHYVLTDHGMWIRDFTRTVLPIDINNATDKKDYGIIVENETNNNSIHMSDLDTQKIHHSTAIIISDGYDFEKKHLILTNLPKNVLVIATNRSLVKWKINRKIDYLVVNNPYGECVLQLPSHKYLPPCIASTRTNTDFINEYDARGGTLYKYASVREQDFSPLQSKTTCILDDYRNPICASISLCYKFGVSRILLFGCDHAIQNERPTAEPLPNGLWIYPQQRIGHEVIDGMLHWYSKKRCSIADHSFGPEYKHAAYLDEDKIAEFL
jgi:hypothetical protein